MTSNFVLIINSRTCVGYFKKTKIGVSKISIFKSKVLTCNMASFKLVDYSSGEESNEESDKNVINIEKFVQEVLLEEILLNVVNLSEVKLDSVIKIDKNPSFDVYRPKKRLLSECSSVVTIGDDQSTRSSSSDSELSSRLFIFDKKTFSMVNSKHLCM